MSGPLKLNLVCSDVTCLGAVPALVTIVVMLFGNMCSTMNISVDRFIKVVINSVSCPFMNCTETLPFHPPPETRYNGSIARSSPSGKFRMRPLMVIAMWQLNS